MSSIVLPFFPRPIGRKYQLGFAFRKGPEPPMNLIEASDTFVFVLFPGADLRSEIYIAWPALDNEFVSGYREGTRRQDTRSPSTHHGGDIK